MKICSKRDYVDLVVGLSFLSAISTSAGPLEYRSSVSAQWVRGPESEREVLTRVVHELHLIEALVAKADQRKRTAVRVSFDYGQLLWELNAVRNCIEEYISSTRMQPRSFASLRADYTSVQTQATEAEE